MRLSQKNCNMPCWVIEICAILTFQYQLLRAEGHIIVCMLMSVHMKESLLIPTNYIARILVQLGPAIFGSGDE